MAESKNYQDLLQKIQKIKQGKVHDLSTEEDLSLAIMNLISLEEHFYFTAEKTGKGEYFDLLSEVREVRKTLLARMMDKNEGETWCISKHLLAATMRLIEVGTKEFSDGKKDQAKQTYDLAYKVFNLFWALRLKLIELPNVEKIGDNQLNVHDNKPGKQPWQLQDIMNKLVNCCDE